MFCRGFIVPLLLLLPVLAGGCRRVYTFVPVEGIITKGGKPLVGAHVFFYADADVHTEGPRSWAMTDVTGHYRLRTDSGDDGAVVGQHRVCIVELTSSSALSAPNRHKDLMFSRTKDVPASQRSLERPTPKVPLTYGSIDKTPLRANVRPGDAQTFDFDIP